MADQNRESRDGMAPDALLADLMRPEAWPHPVSAIERIETHISWVILTGEFAYKIKKPVRLEFLDFSTLAQRRHFCEEELRLNRHFAPSLYLDVKPIGIANGHARVDCEPAIEYAVRMRQFPVDATLDRQLAAGLLSEADLIHTAQQIAGAHTALPPLRRDEAAEAPKRAVAPIRESLDELRAADAVPDRIVTWLDRHASQLTATFKARARTGHIRECHGDLHLRNLVRLGDEIRAFDCIEFDPQLREIDTQCDIAFLVMDLMAAGRRDLAFTFLNRYLECGGDYAGLEVLPLYLVYRCLVRAKVAMIQSGPDDARVRDYIDLAATLTEARRPRLLLMHGLSGSGKTWLSQQLIGRLPAIRLRSDLERKRLQGLDSSARTASGVGSGIYTAAASTQTYARLETLAGIGLAAGFNMIVDAAFLSRDRRRSFVALGHRAGAEVKIVDCRCEPEILRRRVTDRARSGKDASEADIDVLDYQLATQEPLGDAECGLTVTVDTARKIDAAGLARIQTQITAPEP